MIDISPALAPSSVFIMNRHDSGFNETWQPKDLGLETNPATNRSKVAATRPRKSKNTSPNVSISDSPNMDMQRPASEKPSPLDRKQPSTRRKSIASNSSNSTNTRRRGYDSIPSSRRTSCTIVDPSRPARHYRIKSSQTCPTANRDIDDMLALHFRSCSLFQNPSYQAAAPTLAMSGKGHSANTDFVSRPVTAPHINDSLPNSPLTKEIEDTVAPAQLPDTTMHWMSPRTRKTQYERIDRANTGLRGLFKRVVPRCVSGPPTQTFYENDKSDVGSVRRFRMDMSEDDEVEDEKDNAALRMQRRKLTRTMTKKPEPKKKLWGCF